MYKYRYLNVNHYYNFYLFNWCAFSHEQISKRRGIKHNIVILQTQECSREKNNPMLYIADISGPVSTTIKQFFRHEFCMRFGTS